MKKQEILALKQLATGIGSFIRYWGFRNIHGEIWTTVYLSKEPLSGIEICTLLSVSKALVSPALKELEVEGLIRQAASENSKTKRYQAEEDVNKVIHEVLKRREKLMIEKIQQSYLKLGTEVTDESVLNHERLQKMGAMIQMAELGLSTLLQENIIDE